jgi:hypothetical protein
MNSFDSPENIKWRQITSERWKAKSSSGTLLSVDVKYEVENDYYWSAVKAINGNHVSVRGSTIGAKNAKQKAEAAARKVDAAYAQLETVEHCLYCKGTGGACYLHPEVPCPECGRTCFDD